MRLKAFLVMVLLCLFFESCAFKSGDGSGGGNGGTVATTSDLKIDPNGDSDGDGVKDSEEVTRGSNPFVADLPELKVKFLQNYKIEVFYHPKNGDSVKDQKNFVIDTNVKDTNPDFKFRVGEVFARKNALKKAASFARFPNNTKGVIEDRDFSWVNYPSIDPRFFHENSLKYQDVFNELNVIDNIKLTLSNQVKLNESPFFKEVKDLKLNFYFFNHETENYELLKTVTVDRHFQAGIFETFETVIENAPVNLIKDSFFKRGEFIISEVDDFSVPALETNYKTLLGKVKAKSIPVLFESPLEEKFYYVASGSNGIRFQDILKTVFDRNYEIKEDSLTKIKEFQNNLPDFTYLSDVADKDKLGRWFVMTNEFREHYLDHLYTPSDRIVLSYNVGSELAFQNNEQFFAYENQITSNRDENVMPLGNANQRSVVNIQLHPINRFGTSIQNEKFRIETPSSCGKNCIPKHMICAWDINKSSNYDEALTLTTDLTGEAEKLFLVIDGDEFKLTDLLKDKKLQLYRVGNNIHLEIGNLSKIKEIKPFDEVNLSLKLKAFKGNTFFGVKLVGYEDDWRGFGGCAFNTPAIAESRATHISNQTLELNDIRNWATGAQQRGWKYPLQYLDSGDYFQEIRLGVSSTVQNYYN